MHSTSEGRFVLLCVYRVNAVLLINAISAKLPRVYVKRRPVGCRLCPVVLADQS